ncbi:MAG: disulfide bond formation protein B [Methylovirgula sp.]
MRRLDALRAAIAILFLAAATLAGAFVFQALGHAPCELCLKERIPYYIGIVVALFAILLAVRGPRRLLPATFAALFLIFAASAAFGAYHAGIEWGFWAGPSSCTGTIAKASSMQEFLHELNTIKVVRCDAVAIRILGLSLAGWNAVISVVLAGIAALGIIRAR